jgi:hypothetical protein
VEKDSLFYIVESVEKEKALSDVILKGESAHPLKRNLKQENSQKMSYSGEKADSDVIFKGEGYQ